jgi:hypothetical protein
MQQVVNVSSGNGLLSNGGGVGDQNATLQHQQHEEDEVGTNLIINYIPQTMAQEEVYCICNLFDK